MKRFAVICLAFLALPLAVWAFPLRLLNIDASLLDDERTLPVFPLLEIRKAQNACETLQGELRMRQPSQRLPKEVLYSTASVKAVRDLCFELAREKDRIVSGRPLDDIHLVRLKQQSEGTRQTLYYAYFLRSSPYIRLMRRE